MPLLSMPGAGGTCLLLLSLSANIQSRDSRPQLHACASLLPCTVLYFCTVRHCATLYCTALYHSSCQTPAPHLHACASTGAHHHECESLLSGVLNEACQLLTHHTAHAATHEPKLHHSKGNGDAVQHACSTSSGTHTNGGHSCSHGHLFPCTSAHSKGPPPPHPPLPAAVTTLDMNAYTAVQDVNRCSPHA